MPKSLTHRVRIVVDERERASLVPNFLSDLGGKAGLCSASDVAVERKTVSDFVSSIYDGRLFKQLAELH
ncbi:MAG: hypothetical protein HXX80_03535 [Nitrososphaerales archaeon]|nr:hypothetical protein [Nitrososphaerales archaeon]